MLTEFEKQEAFNALRAKILDATRLAAQVTTDCADVIAQTADTATVTQINAGKVAYDALRTNSAEYGNHTLSALVNSTLFNEIASEASEE
jgi:hypothetical protein